jgi:cAMP-dependent protein kinase regulator
MKSQDEDEVGEIEKMKKKNLHKEARKGISAEAYGEFNEKKKYIAKIIKKTPEQISRIKSRIISSFIFQNLDHNDIKYVVDAMEEKIFQ